LLLQFIGKSSTAFWRVAIKSMILTSTQDASTQ
jgi:hypothetical protein